jgi:hypothetical protein
VLQMGQFNPVPPAFAAISQPVIHWLVRVIIA